MYTIYLIINQQNNKIYIGSSVSFTKRKSSHLSSLRRSVHYNYKLQEDFNIYEETWFKFYKLKEYKDISYEKLLDKEQYYIDKYKPDYNIAKNVEQPYLGRKHSKETKEKIRKANTGIKFTKERCKNISKSKKGKPGHDISIEAKNRMRNMRISKPVNQYDLSGNLLATYPSTKEAMRQTGINHGSISSCCNPKATDHKTSKGFIFKWATVKAK